MSKIAIRAENISKQYRLGEIGTGTISHDLNRWWHKVKGKEDPYLKIGDSNNRSQKGESDYVWSLKDINFEINQGDAVGLIGRNGAGKSTLLKLLSKVTKPTTGQFKVNGRIASLLEVGTGFHPEMTGRENIYLNGAILGMRRAEITLKFDEIVDFAGIERYIDTPVKRYSSGMYVRLAFAVAAHLESEILIVDEVLAVGDAEFQSKCLGKMGAISNEEGRTVIFVSHNMHSIQKLCPKSIYLSEGQVKEFNNTANVITNYLNFGLINNADVSIKNQIEKLTTSLEFKLTQIKVLQNNLPIYGTIKNGLPLEIIISYSVFEVIKNFRIYIDILDSQGMILIKNFHDCDCSEPTVIEPGLYTSKVIIPSNFLAAKKYIIKVGATIFGSHEIAGDGVNINIAVIKEGLVNRGYISDVEIGLLAPLFSWENRKIS